MTMLCWGAIARFGGDEGVLIGDAICSGNGACLGSCSFGSSTLGFICMLLIPQIPRRIEATNIEYFIVFCFMCPCWLDEESNTFSILLLLMVMVSLSTMNSE